MRRWVVRLADLKAACGWPSDKQDKLPTLKVIDAYEAELRNIRIVDPLVVLEPFLLPH